MEPVTHLLTGACLARAGCHRKTAYAIMAMAVAAEFPDIDTLWRLRGPVAAFQHHRGITHTFVGIPFEAAFLLGLVVLWHRWRRGRGVRAATSPSDRLGEGTPGPNWAWLYAFLVLALLSHILLDFTNNYGVRPLFPFAGRWYAASIVFIFDPLIFALLVAGLCLPALFRVINREIGASAGKSVSPGWAAAALCGVVLIWGFRAFEHQKAISLAELQTLRAPGKVMQGVPEDSRDVAPPSPQRALLNAQRALASPDPINPFRWYATIDFGPAYQLGNVDTRRSSFDPTRQIVLAEPSPETRRAEATQLGRVYLDWSPLPIVTVMRGDGAVESEFPGVKTVVQFADPRFLGGSWLNSRGGPPPLSGEVLLDAGGEVIAQGMDGRFSPLPAR